MSSLTVSAPTELHLARRMSRLGTETAFEVLVRARALEKQGRHIVHLEIGEPDFDTPAHIAQAGIEAIKSGRSWARRQALAHTLSQDLRLANDGHVPIERLTRVDLPVLAMAGEASPPWAASAAATLAAALPHAVEQIVDGQQHLPADSVMAAILERFFW